MLERLKIRRVEVAVSRVNLAHLIGWEKILKSGIQVSTSSKHGRREVKRIYICQKRNVPFIGRYTPAHLFISLS